MSLDSDIYLDSGKSLTLFLDIDGVFNVPRNHIQYGGYINPDLVQNLQYIVNKYKANVCWISSWRRGFTSESIFNIFIGANLRVPVKQRLSNLPLPERIDNFEDRRGPIIQRYCAYHNIKLDEILIIDDDGPNTLMDRWVKTNTYDGFTFSRALEAERILNGEPITRDPLGTLLK